MLAVGWKRQRKVLAERIAAVLLCATLRCCAAAPSDPPSCVVTIGHRAGASSKELEAVLGAVHRRKVRSGRVLLQLGQKVSKLMIVRRGSGELFHDVVDEQKGAEEKKLSGPFAYCTCAVSTAAAPPLLLTAAVGPPKPLWRGGGRAARLAA